MAEASHNHLDTLVLPVRFIEDLSHADSIEAVLKVGADWLIRLVPCTRAALAYIDGKRVIGAVARTDGRIDPSYDIDNIMEGTPRARVIATGAPLFLNAGQTDAPDDSPIERIMATGLGSMLLVPMLAGGKAVGTLSVAHADRDAFDDEDAQKLMTIGRWIAAQGRLMVQLRRTARQAETDALTGLANRARLMRVLNGPGALHLPDSEGRVVGLLHIDLDHFKEVNDTLGHAAGDAVLRHAAEAMKEVAAPKDLVARIGGDEFVIVTRTDPKGRHLAALGGMVLLAMKVPVRVEDVEAQVGASIGMAIATGPDCTGDRLLIDADMALYEVKRNGRGGVCLFSAPMRRRFERRVRLLSDLHDAVESAAFVPFFQPQVLLANGLFGGFEMLARWPHPEFGLLDPAEFMDLVQEAGLSEEIDRIVRRKGLSALRKLRDEGWHAPKMSFNASARTLGDAGLVRRLRAEIEAQGLVPGDLVLEVRESDLIELGSETAFANIRGLREAGFDVELDDFGAGYASMSTLAAADVSAIKLDGSLIAPLPDKRAETILRAVIGLARDLNLPVTAEGVETPAQFAMLRMMDCQMAQGYGISPPLPLDGLVKFMTGYGSAPIRLSSAAVTSTARKSS